MQAILILQKLNAKLDIQRLKKEIVRYLGKRMVDETEDKDVPGILLKVPVNKEDKEQITKMAPENECIVMFVEGKETSKAYLDLQTIEEDEE